MRSVCMMSVHLSGTVFYFIFNSWFSGSLFGLVFYRGSFINDFRGWYLQVQNFLLTKDIMRNNGVAMGKTHKNSYIGILSGFFCRRSCIDEGS